MSSRGRPSHPNENMTDQNAVQEAVFRAIEMLNLTIARNKQLPRDAGMSLAGLDSLAITNLLIAVEDAVREVLRIDISMTDERTLELIMSDETTPLRTVATLVDYVTAMVTEGRP